MKAELQRIAIAEACGWAECRLVDSVLIGKDPAGTTAGYLAGRQGWMLPDYLNDLNAMHEATLSVIHTDPHVRRLYYQTLDMVTGDQWNTVDATAAQRAEAFLRTMGRWME